MQALHVSDNGRYLVTEDGAPFTWIADTAWTLPQRIKADDVEYYLRRRKEQGFTVLQMVALDPERDVLMRSPAGEPALINGDLEHPNERYFSYLDWVLDRAEHYGFHVLLLPVWGQLVTGDNWMGGTFGITVTDENAYDFGKWIGARYASRKNIVWCLGGDRQPVHRGVDYRSVWRRMAEGLAEGVLGSPLPADAPREAWRRLPLAYHPSCEDQNHCSSSTYWGDDERWLALTMLQSGHGPGVCSWKLVEAEDEQPGSARPVWDGEPAYEDMPTSWPPTGPRHGAWMVRRRAYWSVLAGAFGVTYGHCSVWSSIAEKERNDMFHVDWFEALDAEGANQMRYLRAFLDESGVVGSLPCPHAVVSPETDDLAAHVQVSCAEDGARLFAYLPSGGTACLQMPEGWVTAWCWWYSPRNGDICGPVPEIVADGCATVRAPSAGEGEDWLLMADAERSEAPINLGSYGGPVEVGKLDKVFAW